MTDVVGLDLSLTATGICTADQGWLIKSKAKGMERIEAIRFKVSTSVLDTVVLIEGYSFGSRNSHAHELGELGGVIRHTFYRHNTPYIDVPPATLKLFATGKGNANKDMMIASAVRSGCPYDDNNIVDAWWLRQLGLYARGEADVDVTGYRDKALLKLDLELLDMEIPA